MIRVIDDHPGTRLESARIEGNRICIEMLREPMTRADWTTHDYNVHFCVGVENSGGGETTAELSVNGGHWDALPEACPLLYTAKDADGPFHPANLAARTDLDKRYAVRFRLKAGERLYIANTLVRDYTKLAAEFDALGARGNAERRVIGTTLDGRDMVAFLYGDTAARGTVLVTSGFHPPEPDTLASAAIMDWLGGGDGQRLLEELAVVVMPIANPDGYTRGTQGANAAGINFYWHFAREHPDKCPEAAALWRLAVELAPRGYIDFHCYTFQLAKEAGPYLRPLLFYQAPTVRRAGAALYRRLAREAPSRPVTGFGTFAPHTLGSMLVERFDTIALAKYHLHLAEGETGCRERGLAVFRALADTLVTHGLVQPGVPRTPGWRTAVCAARTLWAGLLRPVLGHLRRGQFGQSRLDRTGLVAPRNAADIAET